MALPTLLALPGGNSSPICTCATCATPEPDLAEVVERAEERLVADRPPRVEAERDPPRDDRPVGNGMFACIKREELEQGRIHGIRCVLARTVSSFGQKRDFCIVSTRV